MNEIILYFISFFTAFFISIVTVTICRFLAVKLNIFDVPISRNKNA